MIFSQKFLIFTFTNPNLAEKLTKLAEIVGPRVVYGVAFSNSKEPWYLVGPGCHQVSSGVVVRIVKGKSRVEALLNTDWLKRGLMVYFDLYVPDVPKSSFSPTYFFKY